MDAHRSQPFTAWILIISLFILGAGGLISGFMLFIKPDGSWIGMPVTYLQGSPFADFLIPGIILFIFVGIFQVFADYGLITRTNWQGPNVINPYKNFHWSWTAGWVAGVIMLIWITVETALLGYISILQPVILVWSIVLITLTLLPSVRQYYRLGTG
jgi:cytochrome c oxidase subunit IV